MSLHPPASGEQPLRTPPPSSDTLNQPTDRERKRKRQRDTEPAIAVGCISKRTRKASQTAQAFCAKSPAKPAGAACNEPHDIRLSPHSPVSNQEPSLRAQNLLSAAASTQEHKYPPSTSTSLSDPRKQGIERYNEVIPENTVQETETQVGEDLVANGDHCVAPHQNQQSNNQGESPVDPVYHWALDGTWPREYFEQDHSMSGPIGRKRSASSLKDGTPSELTEASTKEKKYRSPQFQTLLYYKGIIMEPDLTLPPSQSCRQLCTTLLDSEHEPPKNSLFDDEYLTKYLGMVTQENEAMLICDITPLIAPRVELLRIHNHPEYMFLHGHVNVAWGKSVPLVSPPPQPDYCVGLSLHAFNSKQAEALQSLIGLRGRNPLMATYNMYFPFFTCEAKSSNAALIVADRQNTSSGAVAVNALLTLYRAAGRA